MIGIQYRNEDGEITNDDEVSSIFVISNSKDSLIFTVETQTRYPEPLLYGTNKVVFKGLSGNFVEIIVETKLSFNPQCVMAQAGRYNLFVVFFQDVTEDSLEIPLKK